MARAPVASNEGRMKEKSCMLAMWKRVDETLRSQRHNKEWTQGLMMRGKK